MVQGWYSINPENVKSRCFGMSKTFSKSIRYKILVRKDNYDLDDLLATAILIHYFRDNNRLDYIHFSIVGCPSDHKNTHKTIADSCQDENTFLVGFGGGHNLSNKLFDPRKGLNEEKYMKTSHLVLKDLYQATDSVRGDSRYEELIIAAEEILEDVRPNHLADIWDCITFLYEIWRLKLISKRLNNVPHIDYGIYDYNKDEFRFF